jgi:hypothetical protein
MHQKRILILTVGLIALIATIYLRSNASAAAQDQSRAVSFTTPEDAITFYIQAVSQGDVGKIMQASAVDEASKDFKFDLYTARLKVLLPFQSPAPADYPFYVDMNNAQLSWQFLSQVRIFVFSLLSTENVADNSTIIIDADRTTKFMKDVDPARLAQIALKKIGIPNKALMSSAKYLTNATALAHVYGADESTERIALLQFGDSYYAIGFTLLHYGQTWKILNISSPMANTPSTGAPQKITVQGFDNQINQ